MMSISPQRGQEPYLLSRVGIIQMAGHRPWPWGTFARTSILP